MDIGMTSNLIGTKRSFKNASQQRLKGFKEDQIIE